MQYYLMKSYGGYSIAIEVLFWVGGFFWCFFLFPLQRKPSNYNFISPYV